MSELRTLESPDVVIVGAGFSGLYMLHRLRELGFTAQVIEAGDGVGGTWYWNRYPGARVDIESHEYCYTFSQELVDEWRWSERYAAQPEILAYLNHVADRFDLRRDISFSTRVTSAVYDEADGRWTVKTDMGRTLSARYCVMATGCLSAPKTPDIPGASTFKGPAYHTGQWPHEPVDFAGKRVGVIGTGSSAIQSIPQIAAQAAQVYVFQRTPNFSVPAHNGPADPVVAEDFRRNRAQYREQARQSGAGILAAQPVAASVFDVDEDTRRQVFEARWARGGFGVLGAFSDVGLNKAANDTAAGFVVSKIREIVKDPVVAEKLAPRSYPIGAKRLCVDTGYYETFNRDNVALVDLTEEPITEITADGVTTARQAYPVDALVYAVGFDAMTGALAAIDIRGRGGEALADAWAAGPRTYLGLMVAGFPNLFLVTGPGSPSVLSNMAVSIEQHVDWITDCMRWMGDRQMTGIEASPEAQDAWVAHVNEVASFTLYPQAASWYMGANVPGKPRVFMPYIGGLVTYVQKCAEVAAKGYEGFRLTSAVS